MDDQNVLILSALQGHSNPLHRALQIVAHGFKKFQAILNKGFAGDGINVLFSGDVVLVDLVGLFKKTLFDLQQVPVIPGQHRDLAGRVWNFTYDAHR